MFFNNAGLLHLRFLRTKSSVKNVSLQLAKNLQRVIILYIRNTLISISDLIDERPEVSLSLMEEVIAEWIFYLIKNGSIVQPGII